MNQSFLNTAPVQLQQKAYNLLLKEDYDRAATLYEELIDAEPDVKSNYWYLGLTLLLQGKDVEAQTTWFMAVMEGEAEQVAAWNDELVTILQAEAERREKLEQYVIAEKIRQSIKEIAPENVHNLLNLLRLSIKLDIYSGDELEEWGVINLLQTDPIIQVDIELLIELVDKTLNHAPTHPSTLDFLTACLPYCQNNTTDLLAVLLPTSLELAYSKKIPKIAILVLESYLKISPNNIEVTGHLASFYRTTGEYKKCIDAARTFFELVEKLADKIYANRQLISGLMSAGGYWEESCDVHRRQELLVKTLIEQQPNDLDFIRISRLFNANYFTPYIEDNPRKNRIIQNQLMQVCQKNTENNSKKRIEHYIQGHENRKNKRRSNKRLKIGYLSHCFRSHSVGWLARWLFEYCNQEKFEIHTYFISTNPAFDPLHEWYLSHTEKLFKSNSTLEIAEQIYQDEIDILIDLDSITLDISCGIIALKPAPIQVTWLGWDASGIPAVDYFIADPYVLPESAQEYYTEKIWRLPQTYIAVDGFEVSVPTVTREELDIPDDAVVFFSAQRGFKRHPEITKLQLRIIKEVPNSYLLIKGLSDEESIKTFFEKLAKEEEVDTSKLRFLPIVASESVHRANLGIADIVLDTYPYNGATTTLETLWMCIPMVTKVGEQFAARNSYTMMMNTGITEGIAWSDEEYLEWGVRLGKDESLRQQIAWKLRQSRKTSPLWNGKQFTREMENAYTQMWQKYLDS